jgi:hypothetical protein
MRLRRRCSLRLAFARCHRLLRVCARCASATQRMGAMLTPACVRGNPDDRARLARHAMALTDTGMRAMANARTAARGRTNQDKPRTVGLEERRRRELGTLSDALGRQKERLSSEELAADMEPDDARRYLGARPPSPGDTLDQLLLWCAHARVVLL